MGRGGLLSFSLLMRPRHFFFRPPPKMAPTQAMIGPTLEHSYVCQSTERDCLGRTRGGGDKVLFLLHWFFYNGFEDAQAPTQVQWRDAEFELTVKWHLTDRLRSPMRTYCVLGYLLLEPHWSPTQRSIFARCIATQKQAEFTSWQRCSFIFSTRVNLVKQDGPKIYKYRRRNR